MAVCDDSGSLSGLFAVAILLQLSFAPGKSESPRGFKPWGFFVAIEPYLRFLFASTWNARQLCVSQ